MAAAILKTLLHCIVWAGVFLACRVAVWRLGQPWWRALPAMFGVACVYWFACWIRSLAKREKEERLLADPPDPKLSCRIRVAWKRGQPFRKGKVFPPSPEPAWYVGLKMSESLPGDLVELGDAALADTSDDADAFTWRRGPDAAWMAFPGGLPDDRTWRAFTDMLGRLPRLTPPAGVVVRVDAVRLLNNTHATVHTDAPRIRKRVESLQKACRKRLPLYLVVDNLDRLYGLRSVIARHRTDFLARPLGGLRSDKRKAPAEFIASCINGCLNELGASGPLAGPAALQAPDEIRRLETPLVALAAQLCKSGTKDAGENGKSAKTPFLRGLFLSAAAPGGEGVPPLLTRLATFQPVEETLPVQPWFLRTLLRETIPADADASRRAAGVPFRLAYPAGALGLLLGSVVLCLGMTCSFLESRGVLLSAKGRAFTPTSPEKLQPYLELATMTRLRNNGWRLPRFGMTEPEALEAVLRRRFTESYFDLKTVPSIEHVQDAAIAAVESGDPVEIGNSLLRLIVTREGIGRNLPLRKEQPRDDGFLRALVETLELATPEDMRQLETYFAWAGRQSWMPETHAALADFEKYVVDNAGGGDFSWLPAWIDSLPELWGVDTGKVWDFPAVGEPNPAAVISPAWTLDGYRIAGGLLSALLHGADETEASRRKREQALARHREKALEKWRAASAVLWDGFRSRTPDAKIGDLFAAAARGDDPAARFTLLIREHLLPMFEGVDDPDNPALRRLRVQSALLAEVRETAARREGFAGRIARAVGDLGSDSGLEDLSRRLKPAPDAVSPAAVSPIVSDAARRWREAIRRAGETLDAPDAGLETVRAQFQAWGNPGRPAFSVRNAALAEAAKPAAELHESFRKLSGGAAWDGLSPLASFDYMRYLAARQAALRLDLVWREQVYQPAQLTAGDEAGRLVRLTGPGGPLEKFLTGPASGFWRWDGEKLVNGEWNRLPFTFDRGFLDFCAETMRGGAVRELEPLEMPLRVDAVLVDAKSVEKPIETIIRFKSGNEEQAVSFRNYRTKGAFTWRPGDEILAEIRFVFPSITAAVTFDGVEGVAAFIRHLTVGDAVFTADSFPERRDAFARMGIGRIVLRASLGNGEQLLARLAGRAAVIPETIIARSPAPDPDPEPASEIGPLSTSFGR